MYGIIIWFSGRKAPTPYTDRKTGLMRTFQSLARADEAAEDLEHVLGNTDAQCVVISLDSVPELE